MIRLSVIFSIAGFLFGSQQALGQTRFLLPDTVPDYRQYKYVEECMSAFQRIFDSIEAKKPWADTLEGSESPFKSPYPPEPIEKARLCLEPVKADTLPLNNVHYWAESFLKVNRDADAELLYKRYFDSVPDNQRIIEFIKTFRTYLFARPVRIDALRTLYKIGLSEIPKDSSVYIALTTGMMTVALLNSGDHEAAKESSGTLLSLLDGMSDDVKDRKDYQAIVTQLYPTILLLFEQEGLDSLAVSTMAYRAFAEGYWKRMTNLPFEHAGLPIAAKAPQLKGDFAFQSRLKKLSDGTIGVTGEYDPIAPDNVVIPGKVNVIFFVQGGCHAYTPIIGYGRANGDSRCWGEAKALSRIKKYFPNVEITLVSRTFGNLGDAPPLTPAQEADTLAKYFLSFFGIPAKHHIVDGSFVRISQDDRRKVDTESDYQLDYVINGKRFAQHRSVVVIDKNGEIFYTGRSLQGNSGVFLRKQIGVLNDRAAKSDN